MSETTLVTIVATALFVGLPTLIAAALQRVLRNVSVAALQRCVWGFMGAAAVGVLVLVALNPGRSGSAELKTFGNIFAGLAFASIFAAIVIGYVIKQRRG